MYLQYPALFLLRPVTARWWFLQLCCGALPSRLPATKAIISLVRAVLLLPRVPSTLPDWCVQAPAVPSVLPMADGAMRLPRVLRCPARHSRLQATAQVCQCSPLCMGCFLNCLHACFACLPKNALSCSTTGICPHCSQDGQHRPPLA